MIAAVTVTDEKAQIINLRYRLVSADDHYPQRCL